MRYRKGLNTNRQSELQNSSINIGALTFLERRGRNESCADGARKHGVVDLHLELWI